MWDMKLHDIGSTMAKAARNIARLGSDFLTIHATACDKALAAVAAAAEEAGGGAMPLAVTVLTDLDESQCHSRFRVSPDAAVRQFAKNAHCLGIRGFVCSAKEARAIRDAIPGAYIMTPGIRPLWAVARDEQKRVTTPAQAKQAGADAIVVGRPISKPPSFHTEASAAQAIKEELEAA
jgi:orotidine-5'-phosphate decarboxylase